MSTKHCAPPNCQILLLFYVRKCNLASSGSKII